jgi:hypothetical protein
MPVRSIWSGVQVHLQSALGVAQDVTAITKASPPVLSYTGAIDPVNGDYILLTNILGMSQANERVFRVANVIGASNTLELEGQNSTNWSTFITSPASMQIITFGTSLQIVTGVNASGGEPEEVDATTIHDTSRVILYGAFTPSQFQFDMIWDPADAGLISMKQNSDIKAKLAVRFTMANNYKHVFYGQLAASGDPGGTAQALVTTPARITRQGTASFYAT